MINGSLFLGATENKKRITHKYLNLSRTLLIQFIVAATPPKTGCCEELFQELLFFKLCSIAPVCSLAGNAWTYCSGDGEEPVEADEHDVEDRCRTQHVVHHQPQLTQTSAQPPLSCQHVGNIHWDTEPTYRGHKLTHVNTASLFMSYIQCIIIVIEIYCILF